MALVPLPLEKLLRVLGRLPGLGPRSAQRVALTLLQQPAKLDELVLSLQEARARLGVCATCGNLAFNHDHAAPRCEICADMSRDSTLLCVVESVADVWALERGGTYRGRYFVLGGVVSAMQGIGPEAVRLPQLVATVRARVAAVGAEPLREVILALGASVDGQTTSQLIVQELLGLVVISSLAKGMPVGAAVDYLDEGTLSLALAGRQKVS